MNILYRFRGILPIIREVSSRLRTCGTDHGAVAFLHGLYPFRIVPLACSLE